MKANELNHAFFYDWGLPFIKKEFPGLENHIAVGCFSGSQTLGADDHLSQDHGWGPSFAIVLDDDYDLSDKSIVDQICASAPLEFQGYRRKGGHDTAVSLVRLTDFFKNIFGNIPETDLDWLCCQRKLDTIESALYFLRNGPLFYDGSKQFHNLRQKFSKYPQDIHLLRMADCVFQIAHYGEYNFVGRLVERGDPIPMQMALGHFTQAVMQMYFYLDGDFAPYWKWLAFEFRKRQYSPATEQSLEKLLTLKPNDQANEITTICGTLRDKMITENVVPSDIENPYSIPWFFMFIKPILDQISDKRIRDLA